MNTSDSSMFQYDVALSFAGEDRAYVEEVAQELVNRGARVFYDRYARADLWGKDLYEHLIKVYRERARYCLMFLSQAYASKVWTTHERRAAQARALGESLEYILPVKLEEVEVPGILPTMGFVESREFEPAKLAQLVIEKLRGAKSSGKTRPLVGVFADFVYLWFRTSVDFSQIPIGLLSYARRIGPVACLWAGLDSRIGATRTPPHGLLQRVGFTITTSIDREQSDAALKERISDETLLNPLDVYVIATGDNRYYEKVCSLLKHGLSVHLIAAKGHINRHYLQLARERKRQHQRGEERLAEFRLVALEDVVGNAGVGSRQPTEEERERAHNTYEAPGCQGAKAQQGRRLKPPPE